MKEVVLEYTVSQYEVIDVFHLLTPEQAVFGILKKKGAPITGLLWLVPEAGWDVSVERDPSSGQINVTFRKTSTEFEGLK